MKKIAAIFSLLCMALITNAQQAQPATDSFHFSKNIPVLPGEGRHFRYEMAVSSTTADNFAGLSFYGLATKGNKLLTSHTYKVAEQRTEQDWTILTIEGVLPSEADALCFFTRVSSPGTYYFDDLSLYLETARGNWKQHNIVNHSFEQLNGNGLADFAVKQSPAGNPKALISGKMAKTGRFSLMITYLPSKETPRFVAGED